MHLLDERKRAQMTTIKKITRSWRQKDGFVIKGGFGECTLVPVFVPGEYANVPSFWFFVPGEHPNAQHQSENRKRWRQTGSRQSTPLPTIRTRYGDSVSIPEATRTCRIQQNSLRKEADTEFQFRLHIIDADTIADAVFADAIWGAANGGLRDGGLRKSEDIWGKRPFSSVFWIFQVLFRPSGKGRKRQKKGEKGRFRPISGKGGQTPLKPPFVTPPFAAAQAISETSNQEKAPTSFLQARRKNPLAVSL